MARQKAQFLPGPDETIVEFDTEHYDDKPKTDHEKKLDAIIEALSQDDSAHVVVHREIDGGNQPMKFIDRYPIDKFQDMSQMLAHLASSYPSGEYRVMVYSKGKLAANRLFPIEARQKTGENSGKTELSAIVEQLLDRSDKTNNMLIHLMRQQNTKGDSEMDFLQKMVIYKELFSQGNSGGMDGIAQLTKTVELMKTMGLIKGEENEERSGFERIFEKAAPLFTAALSHHNTRPQQHHTYRRASEAQDPINNGPIDTGETSMNNMMIKMGLQQLIGAAHKGSDPGMYAELVLDQLPESAVKEFILAPGSFEKLSAVEPLVLQYKTWFGELVEHIKAQLGMPSAVADQYPDDTNDLTGGKEHDTQTE